MKAKLRKLSFVGLAGTCLIALQASAAEVAPASAIRFNQDVRPILSENCFFCHGQDAARRKAKLRLDERASAVQSRENGAVIVPGRPGESELILRITSPHDDERMPPPDSHRSLSAAQIALLKRWVAEGAPYEKHWAFIPPVREPLPAVRAAKWPRGAIDRFVLARLEREGLAPAAEASPETWLRRVTLDLTGLPPTPSEIEAFMADRARRGEPAYDAAVERLLVSPHYGERMALEWLDAARYADTHGFNNDSTRTMWRWRDWVIEAFNRNRPYDRFITEQIAGDLLPQPTLEQRIATGFSRSHVINSEGGIIDEEYRVEYVADRVRTLSTVWLGLTFECSRCHDHKFDPVTQRDYYRLFAFFNSVPEQGEDGRVANAVPWIPAPTTEQQRSLAKQERELSELDPKLRAARAEWRWRADDEPRLREQVKKARTIVNAEPSSEVLSNANARGLSDCAWRPDLTRPAPRIPTARIDFGAKDGMTLAFWLRPDADNSRDVALFSGISHLGSPADATFGRGREIRLIDGEIELRLSERMPVYAVVLRTDGARISVGEWRHVAISCDSGKSAANLRVFIDGEEIAVRTFRDGLPNHQAPKNGYLIGADDAPNGARWRGMLDRVATFRRPLPGERVRALFRTDALPLALEQQARGAGSAVTQGWLRDALLTEDASSREVWARRTGVWESHLALRRSIPTTMVMQELPEPRPAFVLTRGQYDQPGERVQPGVPEELIAPWPAGAPQNRLGLARWLTRPDHPMTSRVVVNRFWAQLFGTGIVKTLEDFGSQSEWPSHPELLDWLAREFVDSGWNVKALIKSVVLSATYRQNSAITPESRARDPENRLLARGPRVRLPVETIRDQALAVSGLLTRTVGGPSVFPYQPDKIYESMVVGAPYPGTKWLLSSGEDLYRRTLYTFWKRTVPHPAMLAFDVPDREFCVVRRATTNTPLQALVLWNEPGYLEAARQLGTRMWREGGGDDSSRLRFAFRLVTGRRPTADETRVLGAALARLRADFARTPSDADAFVKVGASPVDVTVPPLELAALTAVANMILNLDEAITKN
ncbi:MAG: DUF1553 domain-containing protein [Opitutus sp.]|nr:DUF1553 domain-containing protein [Opitutus sp.]